MILRGGGREFELRPVAYQFPAEQRNEWDANWLVMYLRVGGFACTDPFLLTAEARELGEWLAAPEGDLRFTEPNLTLEATEGAGGGVDLCIRLAAECRPPGGEGAVIRMAISREDLRAAGEGFLGELAAFPVRRCGG